VRKVSSSIRDLRGKTDQRGDENTFLPFPQYALPISKGRGAYPWQIEMYRVKLWPCNGTLPCPSREGVGG